jgi:activator of 2-hydroxyglutaryl-CoA dehydratase
MAAISTPLSTSEVFLGFDIGSVSLNTIVIDVNNNILQEHYDYVHGKPFYVLRDRLSQILTEYSTSSIKGIALTGTGGKLASGRLA